ncbi:MAG: HAMP domain-containing histidine kinase [Bacteroidetes bacterium]|nr:HAMP domain-containing histidine kinase [Bacteroidota bacterium]
MERKEIQLNTIIETILKVAEGNYFVQLELTEENNELDAIAIGINMMIDNIRENNNKINSLNEELLKLNAQKDKFFSIIAHDLKSPFNSILGFSKILSEQIVEENYQELKEYSDIINQSSKRAMELLMNLFEWSLINTGRIEYTPEYFEIGDLINETVLLLSDASNQKSIAVKKAILPNTIVYADRIMMGAVLRNIITNAIKFTYLQGKIVISTERKQNELLISVHDNGVGITKDRITDLFEIDKSDSTLGTQNEKGTGLGVILCKEFVEKNGGKLWVESEVDKGSIFYFTIPFKLARKNVIDNLIPNE